MDIDYKDFLSMCDLNKWAKTESFDKIINIETFVDNFVGARYYRVWYVLKK